MKSEHGPIILNVVLGSFIVGEASFAKSILAAMEGIMNAKHTTTSGRCNWERLHAAAEGIGKLDTTFIYAIGDLFFSFNLYVCIRIYIFLFIKGKKNVLETIPQVKSLDLSWLENFSKKE